MRVSEIRRLSRASGSPFFSPTTMKAWQTLVYPLTATNGGHTLFITSDVFPTVGRVFTVRSFDHVTGRIRTVTGWPRLATLAEAINAMAVEAGRPQGG